MRLFISIFLSLQFLMSPLALAQGKSSVGQILDVKEPQSASEFLFKGSNLDRIISVQLLGAVGKPGIYYVPADTDLLKLLTLAGGFSNETNTDEVLLRKGRNAKLSDLDMQFAQKEGEAFRVDIEKLIESGDSQNIKLSHDDLVFVPKKEPLIGNDMVRVATVVSVILSAVLTGMIIDDRLSQ